MNALLSLVLLSFISQISCKLYIIKTKEYFMIRNTILKKIIRDDIQRAKLIVKATKFFYNKLLSSYYEANEKYHSLSEEDRTIIETIISLTY